MYERTSSMRATWIWILFLIVSALGGCIESENIMMPLNGTWVELSARSDTIAFTQFGTEPAFTLRRGLEKRDGNMLPKHGAGIYCYKITGDTIALEDLLSSAGGYVNFYFNQNSVGMFDIGNFYEDSIKPDEILTFVKIE